MSEQTRQTHTIQDAGRRAGLRRAPKVRYMAVCDRCYTCVLVTNASKAIANMAATSHIRMYPGHGVSILPVTPVTPEGTT
jgi:hypothetical protein